MGLQIDLISGRPHWLIPENSGGSGGGGDATVYGYVIPTTSTTDVQLVKLESGALTDVESYDYTPCHYWRGCVRNLLTKETAYYLNANNWDIKQDGSNSVLTGADGDVVVHIPKFFSIRGVVSNGTHAGKKFFLCSRVRFTFQGETADYDPAFYAVSESGVAEDIYHYAYEAVLCGSDGLPKVTNRYATSGGSFATGDRARSISGGHVWTGANQGTMEQAFRNNGCHGANWQVSAMIDLMLVAYTGSRNAQGTDLGAGMSYAKEWKYEYARMTGRSNSLGNGSGKILANQSIKVTIAGNSEASGLYAISSESATFSSREWAKGSYSIKITGTAGDSTCSWAIYNSDQVVVQSSTAAASPDRATWPEGTTLTTDDAEIIWASSAVNDATLRTVAMRFLGIENFYGNIYKFCFGIYRMPKDGTDGICFTTKASEQETDVTPADAGTQIYSNWQSFAWPSASGYIKDIDLRTCFPIETGGSATTYFADYFSRWTAANDGVPRCGVRSGNASCSTSAGPFYANASYAVASSATSIGGHGSA